MGDDTQNNFHGPGWETGLPRVLFEGMKGQAVNALTQEQAKSFASRWLPAWTGNDPERLLAFYSEDAFYSDPLIPQGVHGKAALRAYFSKLLAQNPRWVWTQLEGIPMEKGFLNKWLAKIPVGDKTLELVGVCLVQLSSEGLIQRNEVYFDRTDLIAEIMGRK